MRARDQSHAESGGDRRKGPSESRAPKRDSPVSRSLRAWTSLAQGSAPVGIQRQAQPGDDSVTSLLVDDDAAQLDSGQMRKSDFLEAVRAQVCDTINQVFAGTGRSSDDGPYVERLFGGLQNARAGNVEDLLRRFAPEMQGGTADEYVPYIVERVRQSAASFMVTGEVTGLPEGFPQSSIGDLGSAAQAPGGDPAGSGDPVQFAAQSGAHPAQANPRAVQNALGSGERIGGPVASRMSSAFGTDLAGVRVHRDSRTGGISEALHARAFTVGEHVAFGRGEYNPGTPEGDGLIAHELAHVIQQRRSSMAGEGQRAEDSGLERDADQAATGVLTNLWGSGSDSERGGAGKSLPSMGSGLRLSRCSKKTPAPRTVGPGPVDCSKGNCPAQRLFIIAYGESGAGGHNTGRLGEIAANTHRREVEGGTFPGVPTFNAATDKVAVVPIHNVNDLVASVGPGNVIYLSYFGHSGPIHGTEEGALFVGSTATPGSNLSSRGNANDQPATDIPANKFRTDGQVRLFGCRGGLGPDPIAQQMADQLRIPVFGYMNSGGAFFTDDPALGHGDRAVTQADIDKKFPSSISTLWLIPINGTPTFQKFGAAP